MAERPGHNPYHAEGSQPQPKSEASPLVPPMGERQSWSDVPHEQLVQASRTLIRQRQEEERRDAESMGKDAAISHPALIIGKALRSEAAIDIGKAFDKHDEQKRNFYQPISFAWNAIAFEHLRYRYRGEEYINSLQGFFAADSLSHHYQRSLAMGESRPDIIKLDPQQVKILDAIAEAADVPHQRGHAEIEIPENLRYYRRYRFSPDGKLI